MNNEVKLSGQALLDEAKRLKIQVSAAQRQRVLAHAEHAAKGPRGRRLPNRVGAMGVSVGKLRARVAMAQAHD